MADVLVLRVDDPNRLADLAEFLGETDYDALRLDDSTIAVELPDELDRVVVEAELGIYLRMWERRNPGAGAMISG